MTLRSPFRTFGTSPEIIRLAVTFHVRFPRSRHEIEDLLHALGVGISRETARFRWNRFGPVLAAEVMKRRVEGMLPSSRSRWELEEGHRDVA